MIGMIASPFGRRFGHVLAIFCRAIPFGALAAQSILTDWTAGTKRQDAFLWAMPTSGVGRSRLCHRAFRASRSTPGLPRLRISVAVETANNYRDSGLDSKVQPVRKALEQRAALFAVYKGKLLRVTLDALQRGCSGVKELSFPDPRLRAHTKRQRH